MKRNIVLRTLLVVSLCSVACGGVAEDTDENQEALGNAGGKIVFASNAKQAIRASGEGHDIPFAVNGEPVNSFQAYTELNSVEAGAGMGSAVGGIDVPVNVGRIRYQIKGCTLGDDILFRNWWIVQQPAREYRRYHNCVVKILYAEKFILESNKFTLEMWLSYNNLWSMWDDEIAAFSSRVTFKKPANLPAGVGHDLAWAVYEGIRDSNAGQGTVSMPQLDTNALYRNARDVWNFSATKTLLWW
jgi:hypothetical protein